MFNVLDLLKYWAFKTLGQLAQSAINSISYSENAAAKIADKIVNVDYTVKANQKI